MRKLAAASLIAGLLLGLGAEPSPAQQTLAAWSSGTTCGSVGTGAVQTILPLGSTGQSAVALQLDQTTTLTAGAMTIEGSFDATIASPNWVTLPAANVINPTSATLAQIGNPYTFVASTNQSFLVLTGGFTQIRIRCSTTITGSGSITPIITPLSFQAMEQQYLALIYGAAGTVATWGGGTLGAMANYGTSPGAVLVPGVNAFVTNTNANGQATMANSSPVVIASNQSTLPVNTAQVNGVTVLAGTGAVGTGAQRVAVGTDTATIAGSAPGTAGTASVNVVTVQGIASMTKLLVTPDANSAINLAQVNGTTVLAGAGAVGTGSQRVAVGQDTTTIAGSAPGTAGAASANVLTIQGVASMTPILANPGTAANWGVGATGSAVPANASYMAGLANSSEPAKATTGNLTGALLDLAGKVATSPYAVRESMVRGSASATGTGATTLIAAGGSNVKTYVTDVECGRNDAGTTAIFVTLSDAASTILVLPNNGEEGDRTSPSTSRS